MLDKKTVESITPEQKENLKAGLSGALDYINLLQYTNTVKEMLDPLDDLKSLKENWTYFVMENFGENDSEVKKIYDIQNNPGFARECYVELVYIINDRYNEFINGKNLINQMINMCSGEAAYNKVMEIVTNSTFINQQISKGLWRSREHYMEKFVKPGFATIDSSLSQQVLGMIQTLRSSLDQSSIALLCCADEVRGIYEYCQDTDYDYYFSACSAEHLDGGSFTSFKEKYNGFEKTPETDAFIEAVLKLLPKIYLSSENLVSMHSDPAKAQAIYDEALANRPSTVPATPLLTKDPLPGTSIAASRYISNYNSTSKPEPVNSADVTQSTTNTPDCSASETNNETDISTEGLIMEITDDFTISGRGQVFCGTLTNSVSVGDVIEILDIYQQILENNVSVTGIEYGHKMWQKAEAGLNVSVLVRMKNPKLAEDALYLRKTLSNTEQIQESAIANSSTPKYPPNRCPHCGGAYKGLFTKKCSVCGRPKQ